MSEEFEGFEYPNTTPVPDIVFDELLCKLTGNELKVLLYIIRRTYGFGKNADAISLSQFRKGITTKDEKVLDRGCGIEHNRTILVALASLETKGYITSKKRKTTIKDNDTTIYKLCFKQNKATPRAKPDRGVVTSGNHVVTPSNEGWLPQVTRGGYSTSLPVVTSGNQQETVIQYTDSQETVIQEDTDASSDAPPHASLSDLFARWNEEDQHTQVSQEEVQMLVAAGILPASVLTSETDNHSHPQGDDNASDNGRQHNPSNHHSNLQEGLTLPTAQEITPSGVPAIATGLATDSLTAETASVTDAMPKKASCDDLGALSNKQASSYSPNKATHKPAKAEKPKQPAKPKEIAITPEAQVIWERWRSLFKRSMPLNESDARYAELFVSLDPSADDLKSVRGFCYVSNPTWFGRDGQTKGRVTLKDVFSNWAGWVASLESPDMPPEATTRIHRKSAMQASANITPVPAPALTPEKEAEIKAALERLEQQKQNRQKGAIA